MRIGIDIMGGDYAPSVAIDGSLLAREVLPPNVEIVFVGHKAEIIKYATENQLDLTQFEIVHTEHWLRMGDHPLKSYSKYPDASIFLGQKLLRMGELDGFCSAGNTGAMLVGAMQIISPIRGIIRPAISSVVPNFNAPDSVILDVGLNPDARPDVLYQYAQIGKIYSEYVHKIENPRVGLMNIGHEAEKGNLITKSTYQLMSGTADFNFIGNIEANSLFHNAADVIVCDGFVGNVILKEAEAFYSFISRARLKGREFELFNFENHGGTSVLGVNAPLVIGHGISNDKAIKNMIIQTSITVEAGIIERIEESLNK